MSLKIRLLIAMVTTILLSLAIMAYLSVSVAVNSSTNALTESVSQRLSSQAVQTKTIITDYFTFIESQIRAKSYSLDVVDAADKFNQSFLDYSNTRLALNAEQKATLKEYYDQDFTGQYNSIHANNLTNVSAVVDEFSSVAQTLQYDFIASSPFPLGEKDTLVDLSNGSDYAKVHSFYHQELRQFLQEFGYYDIFIADINSGNIVYSVFKELDYATNLVSGPYANTGIGEVFAKAAKASDASEVVFSEFKPYRPSYDALAGFAATQIVKNGKPIAVLIFQMPMDRISNIMTHQKDWKNSGFGESGETYLVTTENKLLSESRFFIEDKQGYLNAVKISYPDVAQAADSLDTTVGVQKVESLSVDNALSGKSGFHTIKDYRGVEVFSTYVPLNIGEFTYALIAEIDVSEALSPAVQLRKKLVDNTVLQAGVLVLIAIGVSFWYAGKIIKPLTVLGSACKSLTRGDGDLTIQIKNSGISEIDNISNEFNRFVDQIRQIITQVKTNAGALNQSSERLSSITEQTVVVTKQQRDEAEGVSRAMNELVNSVQSVNQSTQDTKTQSGVAQKGLRENMERAELTASNIKLLIKLVEDSSQVINELRTEVSQITSSLGVINSIADQTNLLALNAAIEAARAGEAGRGFSVVADEVRALATRSQENTTQISTVVEGMNQSSEKSVDAMERASQAADGGVHLVDVLMTAMTELMTSLNDMTALTETVSESVAKQNDTSTKVTSSISTIKALSSEIEKGTGDINEAAHELLTLGSASTQLVERFKV